MTDDVCDMCGLESSSTRQYEKVFNASDGVSPWGRIAIKPIYLEMGCNRRERPANLCGPCAKKIFGETNEKT